MACFEIGWPVLLLILNGTKFPEPFGEDGVPDILILCPFKTGLSTHTIDFESLSGFEFKLECPACRKLHKWQIRDAWIDESGKRQMTNETSLRNGANPTSRK